MERMGAGSASGTLGAFERETSSLEASRAEGMAAVLCMRLSRNSRAQRGTHISICGTVGTLRGGPSGLALGLALSPCYQAC